MTNYVFWPKKLRKKEVEYQSETLYAIAIFKNDTDYVVLDVIPRASVEGIKLLEAQYRVIAEKLENSTQWSFKLA